MQAYVGVTDGDWVRNLSAESATEVNFWRPAGARAFRALSIGEPFFFKTHYPHNRVVGGGFYSGFAGLSISEAWNIYGTANGASSLPEMRARVGRYRKAPIGAHEDPQIGCIFLQDVRFFDQAEPPQDFPPNAVQGKTFPMSHPMIRAYLERMLDQSAEVDLETLGWRLSGPVFGEPHLAATRLGQRAFQGVVRGVYEHRCAITGDRIRPVLEAAHIMPVARGGEHRIDNGLLLRSDVHTLFDAGYIGVKPDYRLTVSPRVRSEFGNGEELYARAASLEPITLPLRKVDRPSPSYLEWHLDEIFIHS